VVLDEQRMLIWLTHQAVSAPPLMQTGTLLPFPHQETTHGRRLA
jgi:hypothetical protein